MNDATPDAVRAAIAEVLTEYLTPGVWPLVIRTPESRDANVKAIAWRIEHRLAQIGAVPAAGEDTVPIPRKWAVALTTTLHNVSGFHALPEQDRRALRNLSAIVAAALAQIGALRPVGVTFSLEEANIIQDALRHGTSVDEALAMLDERVASYLPDAAARAGDEKGGGAVASE